MSRSVSATGSMESPQTVAAAPGIVIATEPFQRTARVRRRGLHRVVPDASRMRRRGGTGERAKTLRLAIAPVHFHIADVRGRAHGKANVATAAQQQSTLSAP